MPRWISVAGLEFGTEKPGFSNETPGKLGKDYFLNNRRCIEALSRAGFRGFRIPFRWERIQPALGGPLDPDAVQHLRYLLTLAKTARSQVLLDLHNFGSYIKVIDQMPLSCTLETEINQHVELDAEDFADLWARLAYALSGLPGIAGYSLMNEPASRRQRPSAGLCGCKQGEARCAPARCPSGEPVAQQEGPLR